MTSYLTQNYKKGLFNNSTSNNSSKKKIKHFSYSSSDKIGKGFSSIVYRGTNDLTNQTVAIKAIDMKGVKDAISREMLDCEIQALTTLNHSNILKCFDVVRETTHCYIITQFCNEGDLSQLLKKKRRLSQSETIDILKDIVNGFVEMGDRRFLHRDLKLANIFMNNGNAVIADFGFAKKNTNSTQREKYNVGSPLYMSPQALKKNIYSIKNDIWSIGIMAFEMLHGETPWECRTQKQLIDKMTRIPVKFKETVQLSNQIKQFIRKCLQVDQKKRMSLEELKMWIRSKNGQQTTQQIQLCRKPFSNIQNLSNNNVLTELTNRLSSRHEKSHSFTNGQNNEMKSRGLKQNKQNSNPTQYNNPTTTISKATIQCNNNILVIQINTFRLIYKIMEKIKKYEPQNLQIIKILGNQVVRRVNLMMNLCCINDQNGKQKQATQFQLKDIDQYLNETKNHSIKKYKSVIKEYHKKYTSQIKLEALSTKNMSPQQMIRDFLIQRGSLGLKNFMHQQELTMYYWMVEFVDLMSKRKQIKKQYLDEVIDPKNIKLSKQFLQQRIKEI